MTSHSLRNDRPDEIPINQNKKSVKQLTKIDLSEEDQEVQSEPRRRKMGSTERQLFNLFEERGN